MKVLLINGSPNEKGCTYTALNEIAHTLNAEGIETEIYHIGKDPIAPCRACRACRKIGRCVIKDKVNDFVEYAREFDGYIIGSPVHYGSASGVLVPFLDRAFFVDYMSGHDSFKHKPGSAIVSARRAGTTATLDQLNKYFQINQMPIISGRYWNMVHFKNRININIAGNLYLPKNLDKTKKYPAIIVGHPFGGVKEQTAGLYAQKLAEMGYITLAFDASFYGESGGYPRKIEVPEIRVEDYSAAVDFMSNYPLADENKIGVIGICGGGCYAVSASQIDHRIKALATISMYDMGRARRQGVGDTISYEERMKTLDEIGRQRTREFRGEKRKDIRALPVKVDESTPQYAREFIEYYENPERGLHPNSDGWYSYTSLAPMMNFFPFVQIETISPRPVLFIAGENAVSKYFSEDAYSKAAEPKELFVIKDATHVDLYDVPKYMDQVLAKLDSYFKKYLN